MVELQHCIEAEANFPRAQGSEADDTELHTSTRSRESGRKTLRLTHGLGKLPVGTFWLPPRNFAFSSARLFGG
jgi:hypothetical protein